LPLLLPLMNSAQWLRFGMALCAEEKDQEKLNLGDGRED
jgi:hypothetical protein